MKEKNVRKSLQQSEFSREYLLFYTHACILYIIVMYRQDVPIYKEISYMELAHVIIELDNPEISSQQAENPGGPVV